MQTDHYNYGRFTNAAYDLATFDGPRVGESMPDLALTTLDGETRRLGDFHGRAVVIETGSLTCPMYAKNVDAMGELMARHPDTVFAVLYVREAHPGERTGPHRSQRDKASAASLLAPTYGERRLVLLDDLEGSAHRCLGLLPNVVYVVGPDGTVVFRGDWNDPSAVEQILDGTASMAARSREHFPPARPKPPTALRALLAGGWRALTDFVLALPGLLVQHRRADRAHRSPSQPVAAGDSPPVHH